MRARYYFIAVAAVALATLVLEMLGPSVNGATAAQLLLLVILIDVRFFGTGPALAASACAVFAFARYFITSTGFAFGDPGDWAALGAFVTMAAVIGDLAAHAERRAAEAHQGRQEIARLYQELQAAFDRASEAEAAKRNEQLKAALLDALTHNLRTPLTAIKAAVTALIGSQMWNRASDLSSEGQHELLAIIDEESDRLNRFIAGLSTERVAGGEPFHPQAVVLEDIVHAGVLRAESLTRDHHVVLNLADPRVQLSVDAASVVEVLYILLDNASKYSPSGTTIHVTASTGVEDDVQLAVADEGPGIPLELADRVFEKFFKVPGREPRDPRRAGIGLGLPIARRLVEAQGGRMWIERPSWNFGTLIAFTLPTVAQAAARNSSGAAVLAAS